MGAYIWQRSWQQQERDKGIYPFLCWSSVLGRCTFRDCRFRKEGGHPLPADVTDKFADRVINVIGKGVVTANGHTVGSPAKKQKGSEAGPGN
jgi:hypothetical protein